MNDMAVVVKFYFLISVLFLGCNMPNKRKEKMNVVYYKEFDIFSLKGLDTLERANSNRSVEVKYDKGMPVFIKYYLPKRTVTLVMEDSFVVEQNNSVYVFSNSNFNGGQPGRHRVYATYYEEFKHLIYVSLNDTLLVQKMDVPPTNNFSFDLYVMQQSKIIKTSKGEFDYDGENNKLPRQQLYLKWKALLMEELKKDTIEPITISKLPPD
jgi:hypothetical protein